MMKYSVEELKESTQINTLESYYKSYQKFISICIGVLSIFGTNSNIDDDINSDLKEFLNEKFPEIDNINKLKSNIEAVEIKNLIKSTGANKIPRFNLKLYGFIYDSLIDFLKSKFNYETITTDNFFRNVRRLIKVKIHLHHSHVTGKIFGYSNDFCNWKVRENKNEIPLIAHNLFGFDMFYFIKGYRASAWGSKDLNFGRNNFTNKNFANIGGEVKFIDTLKYCQKSLGELASTLTEEEKEPAKKLTAQYLNKHYYFCEVWKYSSDAQKEKNSRYYFQRKRHHTLRKNCNMHSLLSTPENGFFLKSLSFLANLKSSQQF